MKISRQHLRQRLAEADTDFIVRPPLEDWQFSPAGITVSLGPELLVPKAWVWGLQARWPFIMRRQLADVDNKGWQPECQRIDLQKGPFILRPGAAILADTGELIAVPPDWHCHVDGRSLLARLFVGPHVCAGNVWSGSGTKERPRRVVLEITNDGMFDVPLRWGMPIAQLTFTEMSSPESNGYDAGGGHHTGDARLEPPMMKLQRYRRIKVDGTLQAE